MIVFSALLAPLGALFMRFVPKGPTRENA
jgi:hypothetical protein